MKQNKLYLFSRQELRIDSKELSQAELLTILSTLCVLPDP